MKAWALAVLAWWTFALPQAQAQPWPSRPVRMVVGYPAGGPADAIARNLAQVMAPHLGQPVVVDNRPGALAAIGSEHVARSAPDGYTILLGSPGFHALVPAMSTLRFDPMKDLPPLANVVRSEMVFVAPPKYKGMTLADWIAQAKAIPGRMNLGAIGTGSSNHLVGELLKRQAGFTGQHVPYTGGAPLIAAVMAGEVDLAVIDMGGVRTHVEAGKMVALAVASAQRSEFLPQVPTAAESGFPGVVADNLYGVYTPVGLPADVQARLLAAIRKAVDTPALQDTYRKAGMVVDYLPPSAVQERTRRLVEQLVPIMRELNIRAN